MLRRWFYWPGNPDFGPIRYVVTRNGFLDVYLPDGRLSWSHLSETQLLRTYPDKVEIIDPDHIAALELAYPEV